MLNVFNVSRTMPCWSSESPCFQLAPDKERIRTLIPFALDRSRLSDHFSDGFNLSTNLRAGGKWQNHNMTPSSLWPIPPSRLLATNATVVSAPETANVNANVLATRVPAWCLLINSYYLHSPTDLVYGKMYSTPEFVCHLLHNPRRSNSSTYFRSQVFQLHRLQHTGSAFVSKQVS